MNYGKNWYSLDYSTMFSLDYSAINWYAYKRMRTAYIVDFMYNSNFTTDELLSEVSNEIHAINEAMAIVDAIAHNTLFNDYIRQSVPKADIIASFEFPYQYAMAVKKLARLVNSLLDYSADDHVPYGLYDVIDAWFYEYLYDA